MQNKQSTKLKSQKHLLTGSVIGVILIITPYIYYLYQGFPETRSLETFFGTYKSSFWENVHISAWVLFGKLIPFMLLLIWFLTCKHWWYHAILVPLCMYAFQIYSTINDDIQFSDTNELYVLAPIIFLMAIFSYTVRTRVFDKIHGIDLSELNRVNWKGELQNTPEADEDDDEDDEPVFMG